MYEDFTIEDPLDGREPALHVEGDDGRDRYAACGCDGYTVLGEREAGVDRHAEPCVGGARRSARVT